MFLQAALEPQRFVENYHLVCTDQQMSWWYDMNFELPNSLRQTRGMYPRREILTTSRRSDGFLKLNF